jgi:hypothetical protein
VPVYYGSCLIRFSLKNYICNEYEYYHYGYKYLLNW